MYSYGFKVEIITEVCAFKAREQGVHTDHFNNRHTIILLVILYIFNRASKTTTVCVLKQLERPFKVQGRYYQSEL